MGVFSTTERTEGNGRGRNLSAPALPARTEPVADYTASRPLALLGFESALIVDGREDLNRPHFG